MAERTEEDLSVLRQRILERSVELDCGHLTPCRISDRATQPNGYTKIGYQGRTLLTHRVAYEAWVGPIPEGRVIDHLCRQRACVNPAHLEPVTTMENLHRGEGLTATEAAQTHCHNGHEFTPANTYYRQDRTGRICRACAADAARARRRA